MTKIEYLAPEMEIVEIKLQGGLLASSFDPDSNNDDNTQTGGEGNPSIPLD